MPLPPIETFVSAQFILRMFDQWSDDADQQVSVFDAKRGDYVIVHEVDQCGTRVVFTHQGARGRPIVLVFERDDTVQISLLNLAAQAA